MKINANCPANLEFKNPKIDSQKINSYSCQVMTKIDEK